MPDNRQVANLDRARQRLVRGLQSVEDGQNVAPHLEEYVPAVLPSLRKGIRLLSRKRVVDMLAGLLAKLIQDWFSQARADKKLRLRQGHAPLGDELTAAPQAVAATIEDAVVRVAALPDYVLEDQELLEGYILQAFEQAASANLPPIQPDQVYKKRVQTDQPDQVYKKRVQTDRGRRARTVQPRSRAWPYVPPKSES